MKTTAMEPAIRVKNALLPPRPSAHSPVYELMTPPTRPKATAVPTPVARTVVERGLQGVDRGAGDAEHGDDWKRVRSGGDRHEGQHGRAGNSERGNRQHRGPRADAREWPA